MISDTSTVWVQGHIYDKDLRVGAHRRHGRRAQRVVPASHSTASVSYIGDMLDPATRTTPVRIVTQNPTGC